MSAMRKLTAISLLLAACGGDSTGPDGGGIGSFSATIDGVAWTSDAATLQVSGAQTIPGTQLISAVTPWLTNGFEDPRQIELSPAIVWFQIRR